MKTIFLAPNLTNSIGLFRRLPLLESESNALAFTGLGFFITYVPSKYGGILEAGCSDANAKVIVRYKDPNGSPLKDLNDKEISPAKRFVYPVRPGEYGWYFIFIGNVSGTYKVWATFKEVGLAREGNSDNDDPLIPWNFWFFPNDSSQIEKTAWGSSTLKPCQKYESAFTKSGVFTWEKQNHNDPHGIAENWEGHCHNSAPASMIFKEPPKAGKKHNGVDFLCEELKFLATEFYGRFGNDKFIWGLPGTGPMGRRGFYQEKKPSDNPRRFGKHIGIFHNNLIKRILKARMPVMMDLRESSGLDHSEVWNQAIYKYEAHFFETTPHGDWMDLQVKTFLRAHGDWMDLQVKTFLRANEDVMYDDFSSSGIPAKIVANGPRPGGLPKDAVPDPAADKRDQVLLYRLIFKSNGTFFEKHKKNRWKSVTLEGETNELHAPRFIFEPKKPTGNPSADGNPLISKSDVLTLLELRDRFK
jgi:hypothetical protein